MASKAKTLSETIFTIEHISNLAQKMLTLEKKSAKRWSKKPAFERGKDLQKIFLENFPKSKKDFTLFALWVDFYIHISDLLVCSEETYALMDIDEAISALMIYQTENPDEFDYMLDWVEEFGCLLVQGVSGDTDIGAWFYDWFWDPLVSVGALEYEDNLHLEKPTAPKLLKLSKSKSVRDRVQVGLYKGTPAELLTILSGDQVTAVRFAVAKNLATPEDVLDKLAKDLETPVREAALANESISVDSLKSTDSEAGKINLASSKKVTFDVLAKLAKDKSDYVRAAVAENKNSSSETLFELAKDKSDDVRRKVADNINSSQKTIKLLSQDKDYLVRGTVAQRENVQEEILTILSKDSDEWVRKLVAESKAAPEAILEELSRDSDAVVRDRALKNRNLSSEAIKSFENPIGVKLSLAKNPSTPLDLLDSLSTKEESIYFQGTTTSLAAAVASNPSISEALIGKLIKSKNHQVKEAIAGNPSLSATHLDILIAESRKKIQAGRWEYSNRGLELGLASNPSIPADYLIELIEHSDTWIVAAAASNPNMPPIQLAALGNSEDENVRQGVAANTNAPWVLLQSLMKEQGCIWRICKNPATRAEDLVEIANQSRDEFVLADVARNAKTPTELILKLAKHKDAWVRLGVADNPNTPIATRQKILDGFLTLKSEDDDGYEYLARCIFATKESLDDLFKRYSSLETENRESILCFVASNPNASSQVLTELARDRFSEIRIAVAGNPKTDKNLLRELSK